MPTPILNLPIAPGGATDLSLAFNEAMQILEAFTPLVVQDKDLSSPPATVAGDAGNRWIIGAAPTGDWSGHAGKIALCTAADVWQILTPPEHVVAYVVDEDAEYRFDGAVWNLL